jgi:hypothetical protein
MLNFREFRNKIEESKASSITEKTVDSFQVGGGRQKFPAKIEKKGSKFVAFVDGDKLDEFKTEKEAREGIKDFVELMDL